MNETKKEKMNEKNTQNKVWTKIVKCVKTDEGQKPETKEESKNREYVKSLKKVRGQIPRNIPRKNVKGEEQTRI